MEENKCKVRGEEHDVMLVSSFNSFYEQEHYLDLVFICEKNIFVKAHKMVVAAVSEFIKNLLVSVADEIVYVSLPGVEARNMRILLNYLYEGLTKLNSEELMNLKSILMLLNICLPSASVTTVNSIVTPAPNNESANRIATSIEIKSEEEIVQVDVADSNFTRSNSALVMPQTISEQRGLPPVSQPPPAAPIYSNTQPSSSAKIQETEPPNSVQNLLKTLLSPGFSGGSNRSQEAGHMQGSSSQSQLSPARLPHQLENNLIVQQRAAAIQQQQQQRLGNVNSQSNMNPTPQPYRISVNPQPNSIPVPQQRRNTQQNIVSPMQQRLRNGNAHSDPNLAPPQQHRSNVNPQQQVIPAAHNRISSYPQQNNANAGTPRFLQSAPPNIQRPPFQQDNNQHPVGGNGNMGQLHVQNFQLPEQSTATTSENLSSLQDVIVIESDDDDEMNGAGATNVNEISSCSSDSSQQSVRQTRGNVLKCWKCDKVIVGKLQNTSSLKPVCDSCSRNDSPSAESPRRSATNGDLRVYTCIFCNKSFNKFLLLLKHATAHRKVFRCKLCRVIFSDPVALRDHMHGHGLVIR